MNRGEVAIVDWPFSDLSGSKLRPAVVVQADFLNGLIDDTIYVKVQGQQYGIPGTVATVNRHNHTREPSHDRSQGFHDLQVGGQNGRHGAPLHYSMI